MEQPAPIKPRDRVAAAYKGQFADRVPAYPIAGSFAGCLDGLSIEVRAALEEIDGEAEPWPGIRIVPTPGHSPGHQSLVVDTKKGRVVLAGQALNFSSDYARHQYSHELALAGESHAPYPDWIGRFHELDPVRVHFAHDRAIWERDVAESIR